MLQTDQISGGREVKTPPISKNLNRGLGALVSGLVMLMATGCGPLNQNVGLLNGGLGNGLIGGANCAPLGSQPLGFQAQGSIVNVYEQRVLAGYIPPNNGPLGWLDTYQGQTFGQSTVTAGNIGQQQLPNVQNGTLTFQSTSSYDANLQLSLVPQQTNIYGTNAGFQNPFQTGYTPSYGYPQNFQAQLRGTVLINPDPAFIAYLYDALYANPWLQMSGGFGGVPTTPIIPGYPYPGGTPGGFPGGGINGQSPFCVTGISVNLGYEGATLTNGRVHLFFNNTQHGVYLDITNSQPPFFYY